MKPTAALHSADEENSSYSSGASSDKPLSAMAEVTRNNDEPPPSKQRRIEISAPEKAGAAAGFGCLGLESQQDGDCKSQYPQEDGPGGGGNASNPLKLRA